MSHPRRSLVTGANRGLGLEFAQQLLERGDHVVATCRQPGRASALNGLVGEYPGRLHMLPLNIADPRSIAELARELPLVCDGLDLLVNNAGVLHSGERFGSVPPANLDDSFRTNASGPLLLTQALAPVLAEGARVVNLSSSWGSVSELEAFRTPSYAISKAAQNMVTALLAKALGERGIVVLAMNPGWVQTDMGGAHAELTPSESVAGMLKVIETAGADDSGRFLDWRGRPAPW
ncbi:SDR family oxidoreductase [Marilutibacter alkalisoli]|uniref:SDR family oxidoreductase n=1 Tax=Marilutibacter alkalisoli TaxID=2591633 RepID=A0A514BVN7_9GAMM|nr:SDR family oxidoreductase [Lysobacter alkalisoli]QDH71375.1 SDR family oxidoreductase [Lysobacter alkalisoli]